MPRGWELRSRNGRVLEPGFSEVVFPTFRVPSDAWRTAPDTGGDETLVLRRAACGGQELYDWWDQSRRGRAPQRRTVRITLLAEDQASVRMRWQFRNARPVALGFSPLRSMESALVIESIELAFDTMEMERD